MSGFRTRAGIEEYGQEVLQSRGPVGSEDPAELVCRPDGRGPLDGDAWASAATPPAPQPIRVLCLDGASCARLIRSTAYARALQERVRLRWVDYDESAVLNSLYRLMPWLGTPGWTEIDIGDQQAIESAATQHAEQYRRILLKNVSEDPAALAARVDELEKIRASCLESVREVFRDGQRINGEIVAAVGTGIKRLAAVRLAADIGVAVAAPLAVDLGYSVTTATIDEFYKGKPIDVILIKIGSEAAKEGGEEVAEGIAKQWGQVAAAEQKALESELSALEAELASRQKVLARKRRTGAKGQHNVGKKIRGLKQEFAATQRIGQRAVGAAVRKQRLWKGLYFVSVAATVADAIERFDATVDGAN